MLLGTKKRTRVSDEENDKSKETLEVFGDVLVNDKNKGKENAGKIMQKVQKDLKKMRLDLDHDNSRFKKFFIFVLLILCDVYFFFIGVKFEVTSIFPN
jgi:hypothetical protein